MADNVDITAGTGTAIATDQVTGTLEHVQVVKLALSADGSRTAVSADADGLLVNLGTNNDVTVTGSVTANAGTNLNTSALALETGGNLAAAVTSLQLIDDPVFVDDAGFTAGTSKVKMAGFLADDASADVADEGDAVAARTTLDRKQIVVLGESGTNLVRGGGTKNDTTDQSIMGAVANKYNYLSWLAIYNPTGTNSYCNVKDGSTVVAVIPLSAYGGAVVSFPVPIRSTVNTAINFATGAALTGATLYGGGYVGY